VFFLVVSGLFTRLALQRSYRTPLGAAVMVVLAVLAFAGSAWIWDNVSNEDAVSTILVALGLAAALLIGLRVARLPIATPVKIVLLLVVGAAGIWAAIQLGGLELGESGSEVPTMLFGLGAIALVNEPRGVVYDIVNRQRLRQFKDAERRQEEAELAAVTAKPAGVPA